MSTIDDRVVAMKFDNGQFERGVKETKRSLEDLKKGLNLEGAKKGLVELTEAGKNFTLGKLAESAENVGQKLSAMAIIGITALVNIANRAVDTGIALARSLTVDPIKSGLQEYETQLNAVQTILANTQAKGTTLKDVNASLDELNTYADKTIYNFTEMTRNIGTFTAAGVDLKTSTEAIKGIANLAALSGSNSQQASTAMYQLSQALSTGTVKLMDWNSVVNAGMGGQVFQDAIKETARAHGVGVDAIIDQEGSFRDSLQKGWLTSEILTETLSKLTGDLSDQQLEAMGYTKDQIVEIQKLAKTASDAATKVKTATQLMETLQEAVGSGWSQTWMIVLGDFEEAKELFTRVSDVLGELIQESSDARNNMLKDWKDLGGRTALIDAVSNAFTALMSILKPIKEAFTEIFPPLTGKQLADFSVAIRDFTEKLKMGEAGLEKVKRTFKGFFALLDIGWMIVKELVGVFFRLFGVATKGAGGILDVTAGIGDFIVNVRDAIKNGDGFIGFFRVLGDILQKPIDKIREIGKATLDTVNIENWGNVWENVGNALRRFGEFLQPVFKWIGEAFTNTKKVLTDFFKSLDFNVLVGFLNVGALAGIGLLLKKGFGKILDFFNKGPGNIIETIKGVFGALTDTLGAMQEKLKAEAMQKLAVAIGILTAAVVVLSFIDTGKLFTALGAMTVMFTQLAVMMKVMTGLEGVKPASMITLSMTMIVLAGAMLMLSGAITIMGNLEWDELTRGLIGLSVGLGVMLGAMELLTRITPQAKVMAPVLVTMAFAVLMLSGAIKLMSTISWDGLARGLLIFSVSLGGLVGAMALMKGKGAVATGTMLILSTSLLLIAGALKAFSTMNWDDIARSMTVMYGAIGALVGAVAILSLLKMAPVGAATMIAMALALNMIVPALKNFATMSWEEIGKSMVVLAGSLAILAGAMALMGIPVVALGGLALLAASTGLMALAPALALLGTMSWDAIGRGLTMLGASMAILAVGGILMIPASVGFLLLGAAIMLIGTGAFLAGTGLVMMATGLIAMAGAGALGAEALRLAVMTIIGLIPQALAAFAQGIIDFALVLANGATEFVGAMTTLMLSILQAIDANAPQIIETLWNLTVLMVQKLTQSIPFFVDAGMRILVGVLKGIASNMGRVISSATDVVVAFINGISASLPRIIQAGVNLIINFVNSMASAIRENTSRMEAAGRNLASAIIDGMVGGIGRGVSSVVNAAKNMAQNALNAAKNLLGIKSPSREFAKIGSFSGEGMVIGLNSQAKVVAKAAENVGKGALDGIKLSLSRIKETVASDMDMVPTIRPVLDLSAVRADSQLISGMFGNQSISLDRGYAVAANISADRRETRAEEDARRAQGDSGATNVTFKQYNTSPKALSSAEIYRQTKNQLSVAKGALT